MRLTQEQDALIRHAAEVDGSTVTDFTVSSAISRAQELLADRTAFFLDDATWAEFEARVYAREPVHKPALEKLLANPPHWGEE
ncbi:MAG: DUF1778 domain-containing protein [Pseudonocardiaceae bacterium]